MQFIWNDQKNHQLIKQRGVSFERVVSAIERNKILSIREHPNQDRYPKQKLIIVEIDEYAWCIPYVKTEKGNFFLKTIFPSRKYTKLYLKGGTTDE